jgi:serine/threonine protein kinase/TolB-like protein
MLSCPDTDDLAAFSLGLTGASAAEDVETHLQECGRCVAALEGLRLQDILVDAMRAQTILLEKPVVNQRIRETMEAVKQLYPAPAWAPGVEPLDFLAPPSRPGDLGMLGSYRIVQVLGAGGMGIVFRAEEAQLNRPAAVKVLRPLLASQAEARQRFLREAQAVAALDHPHVVPIYQVGEDHGVPFLAMPLLEGETLETRWKREGKLPWQDVVEIGRQIAEGLAAAHARGLVHRDVNPANIWLESVIRSPSSAEPEGQPASATDHGPRTTNSRVRILDFGLARTVAGETNLTQPGTLVGTPAYMAPEQAEGQNVDSRSDLFSLGSIIYGLCAGRAPFEAANTMGLLRAICDKTPRPIAELNPDVPSWLVAIIDKLMAKNPADRFQSAAEVAELFRRGGVEEKPVVASTTAGRPRQRRGLRWLTAAAILLVPLCLVLTEVAGITDLREVLTPANPGPDQAGPVEPPAKPKENSGTSQVAKSQPKQEEPNDGGKEQERPLVLPAALLPFESRGAGDRAGKVTDLLFAKLTGKVDLVDRIDLQKTLEELQLNLSGAVKASDATRIGQLTGAKLFITGSVIQLDKKIYIVARIIGTETSRVLGADVNGRDNDQLGPMVGELADMIAEKIQKQGRGLVAKAVSTKDRIAALKAKLKDAVRPRVWIQVSERHVGGRAHDPAAQTEITRFCKETGFTVLDTEESQPNQADVLIKGEGFSETATRVGNLVSVKARLELKAVERATGKVLFSDRQTAVVLDLAEQIASKAALEEAAAILAERMLPRLVEVKK